MGKKYGEYFFVHCLVHQEGEEPFEWLECLSPDLRWDEQLKFYERLTVTAVGSLQEVQPKVDIEVLRQ